VLFAVRPYRHTIDLGSARTSTQGGVTLELDAECSPAITSAWDSGSRDRLALWAVTVGTDMMG
jgi:hypothetical protein